MKTLLIVITALLFACALRAAIVQWSLPTDFAAVVYLMVDGKGGCVLWGIRTNGVHRALWLDKKGAVLYDQSHSGPMASACFSSRGFMYAWVNSGKYETILVDTKGTATTISDAAEHLMLNQGPQINMDKKGFFLKKVPLVPPSPITLVRYSYK